MDNNLRHRVNTDRPTPTSTNTTKDRKKMAMAKKGLRSLAVAIGVPLSLGFMVTYYFPTLNQPGLKTPSWYPPLWTLHFGWLVSHFIMGLSSWLIWVEGGYHKNPQALTAYAIQLFLGLMWAPLMFGFGAPKIALVDLVALLLAMLAFFKHSSGVNPIAADLVKPCFLWVGFVSLVTFNYA
ncbi:hypothetical protein AMTRI_Chr02g265430 [Amborella trichopoda]|uniref:Uncharacterized protein n=1 Tax=Amborella trichopoda TaxID=13333 RepID=W1NX57_AMBTC|nr:translocator protein homolog [Amborella trichopoda]ERN02187.1 hypothetical protein AMTR_s00045p00203220 [Amborella trichopoda]|eukprot:XP_006840512.1 translocator protein homolog [Amborella trichopoda]